MFIADACVVLFLKNVLCFLASVLFYLVGANQYGYIEWRKNFYDFWKYYFESVSLWSVEINLSGRYHREVSIFTKFMSHEYWDWTIAGFTRINSKLKLDWILFSRNCTLDIIIYHRRVLCESLQSGPDPSFFPRFLSSAGLFNLFIVSSLHELLLFLSKDHGFAHLPDQIHVYAKVSLTIWHCWDRCSYVALTFIDIYLIVITTWTFYVIVSLFSNLNRAGGFGSYLFGMSDRIAKQLGSGPGENDYKELSLAWMIGFLFIVSFLGLMAVVPLRKVITFDGS